MTLLNKRPRVFISSTSEDLRQFRSAARYAVSAVGYDTEMMEQFGAMTDTTVKACLDKLDECDLMVLIVAYRRGWVPTVDQGGNGTDSMTALELAHARERGIPVIIMLASDTWPGKLYEDSQAGREWIKGFRDRLNQPAAFFDYEASSDLEATKLQDFRNKLTTALLRHEEQRVRSEAAGAGASEGASVDLVEADPEQVRAAVWVLGKGLCIPFVGPGVHSGGPLSTPAIARALLGGRLREQSLATAAEYHEHAPGFSRARFLEYLEDELKKQSETAEEPAAYDLLTRVRPPLIVSGVVDLQLERRLVGTGKRVLIVCHVIRSGDGLSDGKIALFRGPTDDDPKLCLADDLDLSEHRDDYVIYKPLGSPLLHRKGQPGDAIDTVVMTEADHLVLLGRLDNQSVGIPTAFSRAFQSHPFIFLGYPLDMWHYRLVVKLFGMLSPDPQRQRPQPMAVCRPASDMEVQAWRWLGATLIAMDVNSFARKVSEALTGQP